jgi:hypothetical protein
VEDRLVVIMELGSLATDAAQRGDDRAARTMRAAAELLFADKSAIDHAAEVASAEEQRRRAQAERKRRSRHGTSQSVTGQGVTSHDVLPPVSPLSCSPPFIPHPEDDNNRPREAKSEAAKQASGEAEADALIEQYAVMLHDAMGDELFREADAFVKRRPYETWRAWFREMLALIGPGSQFVAADLAQVCRDDGALDRPIGTPKGLRSFLASIRAERMAAKSAANGATSARPNGAAANGAKTANVLPNRGVLMYGKIRDLITVTSADGHAPHRMIPKVKVGQLGQDVLLAYEQVGGAERFLNVAPSDVSFLIRDFSQALEERSHGRA